MFHPGRALAIALLVFVVTTLAGAILALQTIRLGNHPFLAEAGRADALPWVGSFALAGLPFAVILGAIAGFLRHARSGVLLSLLVLVATFQFARDTATARGKQPLEPGPYPTRNEIRQDLGEGADAEASVPNIVLITIDTLRWDHVGFAGYHRPVSPNLDRLAELGTVFRRGFAQAPATRGSVASLLTGLYPHVLEEERAERGEGPDGAFVAEGFHLLAERVKSAGYETSAFVSNAYLRASNGFGQGFDIYQEHTLDSGVRRHESRRVVDAALEAQYGEGPFFLWVHLLDPHHPYDARLPGPWEDVDSPVFQRYFTEYRARSTDEITARLQSIGRGETPLEPGELDYLIGRYDAEIREVDRQIGRLVGGLVGQGATMENTLLIVTADHGEEFLDHGGTLHGHSLFDELIRVPFLVVGPGFDAGAVREDIAQLVDIAPTALTAAGLPLAGLEGRPLQSAARPTNASLSFLSLAEVALRKDDLKLVAGYRSSDHLCLAEDPISEAYRVFVARYGRPIVVRPRLFDLRLDPDESHSLVNATPLRGLLCELDEVLTRHPPKILSEPGAAQGLTPADVEHLRSLGYVN